MAEFLESYRLAPDDEQRTVLVDIDETIAFYEDIRRYDLAKPRPYMIGKINKLYDQGWYVIYWTARGGSPRSKAKGICYHEFTQKQLVSWGCKFHELSTGTKGNYIKPAADLIIDDKAIVIEDL